MWDDPAVLDDETMVAALQACKSTRRSFGRDGEIWFEALCVLEHLSAFVGGDRRRFGELREPLGAWIERHGRFADEAGLRSGLERPKPTVRYVVIAESEWARLQEGSSPPSAA